MTSPLSALLVFSMVIGSYCYAQKLTRVDSMWAVYANRSNDDTVRMRAIHEVGLKTMFSNADSTEWIYDSLWSLAAGDSNFRFMGYYHHDRSLVFKRKSAYSMATKSILKAMDCWTRDTFLTGLASCNMVLGDIYYSMEDANKAILYYTDAIRFYEEQGDKPTLGRLYNYTGDAYHAIGNDSLALVYLRKSYSIRKSMNLEEGVGWTCGNLAGVFIESQAYDSALFYLDIYLDMAYKYDHLNDIGWALAKIGSVFIATKDYSQAIDSCFKAYSLAYISGSYAVRGTSCDCLYRTYSELGNADSTLKYFMEYVSIKDSLNSQETRADIVHLEDEFRYQQKAIGDSLITVEKERVALERAASDAKIRYALFAGLGLTLIFGVVMFNRFRTTRRQKNLISKQQVETERQKRLIEAKNKEITDSINYAQRIQQAILPPETELKKAFTDIFVLFKPRDIVSGDFYWYEHSKTNRVIALADCTGHGVPGGFMSMLGYEMLQESVMLEEVTTTSEALRRLDRKVTTTLNKNDRSYRDGMDLALCAFSKNKMELQYSGANRPLIHISAGLSAIYKPDKHTIGGAIDDVTKEFTSHTISLAKGDMIYLFSDGYADQFGGPNGKKFMTRKFEQLLLSIAPLDCSQQKMKLETTFKEWKGTLEQVDDVCVVGIRI